MARIQTKTQTKPRRGAAPTDEQLLDGLANGAVAYLEFFSHVISTRF